ncbi:MAG: histidinol dehydrogenase [Longimicrobiales bacterium]
MTVTSAGAVDVEVAVQGELGALSPGDVARLLDRGRATDPAVTRIVADLLADVRERGDAALRAQALRLDGVVLEELEVPRSAWREALRTLAAPVRHALEQANDAISAFHRAQVPARLELEVAPGVRLGRRPDPLRRVGVYAPGGRAAYPSSVLMGAAPARAAGVAEVIVCSPAGPDGRPPVSVLAACAIAGADRVFAAGGAGAIAALAYGTASVPRVDKVVGPGNAYVTEAKRQLTGTVASDCPAGPSEILIIADESADPQLAALELVAQAEHDPDAAGVLITTCARVRTEVLRALARTIASAPRREIIRSALAARGALLLATSLDEALAFAEYYAPEHLLLLVREPRSALEQVRAAGTVFLGRHSSVCFGDYLTGANHVLPTAGLARAHSGLSTLDFVRWTSYQELTEEAAAALAAPAAVLAEAEGLPAHAAAARARRTERSDASIVVVPQRAQRTVTAVPRRAAYRELTAYDPGRVPMRVDLSDNTNLWGPPPAALRALQTLGAEAVSRYPGVYADRLRTALAARLGLSTEQITTGCGSDDVLDSALRALLEPGEALAFAEPTFPLVPSLARMNGLRPVAVPLQAEGGLPVEPLLASRARGVYLCRPNNPTGTLFPAAAVARLAAGLARRGGLLFLDEAYVGFGDEGLAQLASQAENVLLFRTLSKAYGLAGLRVGFAVGSAALIAEVQKSRGPYKVSGAGEAAAVAALEQDSAWLTARAAEAGQNRDRLARELAARGRRTWASAANFLLLEVPEGACALAARLGARGVQVRAFPALPVAGDAIRVTVGPWRLMREFLDALDDASLPEGATRCM